MDLNFGSIVQFWHAAPTCLSWFRWWLGVRLLLVSEIYVFRGRISLVHFFAMWRSGCQWRVYMCRVDKRKYITDNTKLDGLGT